MELFLSSTEYKTNNLQVVANILLYNYFFPRKKRQFLFLNSDLHPIESKLYRQQPSVCTRHGSVFFYSSCHGKSSIPLIFHWFKIFILGGLILNETRQLIHLC